MFTLYSFLKQANFILLKCNFILFLDSIESEPSNQPLRDNDKKHLNILKKILISI